MGPHQRPGTLQRLDRGSLPQARRPQGAVRRVGMARVRFLAFPGPASQRDAEARGREAAVLGAQEPHRPSSGMGNWGGSLAGGPGARRPPRGGWIFCNTDRWSPGPTVPRETPTDGRTGCKGNGAWLRNWTGRRRRCHGLGSIQGAEAGDGFRRNSTATLPTRWTNWAPLRVRISGTRTFF